MRIKIIPENKKGAKLLLENQFELLRDLIQRYPNALWRKCRGKNGQVGYELEV